MKRTTYLSAVAIAASFIATTAGAVSLNEGAKPREMPPAAYKGDVYVDSRGCAYARANIGAATNWVPRLTRDRKAVVCGLNPTFAAGTPRSATPPAPIAPPPPAAIAAATAPAGTVQAPAGSVQSSTGARALGNLPTPSGAPAPTNLSAPTSVAAASGSASASGGSGFFGFGNLPKPSPAPEPTNLSANRRTEAPRELAVTCPAGGGTARVLIGGTTVNINCGASMTATSTYTVNHGGGMQTRLTASPAPVMAQAARQVADNSYRQYRPATPTRRVVVNPPVPGKSHFTGSHGTLVSGTPGSDRMPYTGPATRGGFGNEGGTSEAGRYIAPPAGSSYEDYLAAKRAAYEAAGVEVGAPGTRVDNFGHPDDRAPRFKRAPNTVVIEANPHRPARGYGAMPASNPAVLVNEDETAVLEGYRPAWDDDRLNPQRAARTVGGEQQMQMVWTDTVPRRLVPAK